MSLDTRFQTVPFQVYPCFEVLNHDCTNQNHSSTKFNQVPFLRGFALYRLAYNTVNICVRKTGKFLSSTPEKVRVIVCSSYSSSCCKDCDAIQETQSEYHSSSLQRLLKLALACEKLFSLFTIVQLIRLEYRGSHSKVQPISPCIKNNRKILNIILIALR